MEHRPVRIVIAMLIASVSMVGVLASGVVIETTDIPATFSTPLPKAGDSGRYDMTLIDDSGDTPQVVASVPYLRFETRNSPVIDSHGGGHAALEQYFQTAGWYDVGDEYAWSWGDAQSLFIGQDRQGIASDRWSQARGSTGPEFFLNEGEVDLQGFYLTRFFHYAYGPDDGLPAGGHCFLNHGLQGRTVSTSDAAGLFNECRLSWWHLEPGRLAGYNYTTSRALGAGGEYEYISSKYAAIGTATVDGEALVVFEEVDGGFTFWFREDLAYPVRVTHPGTDGYRLVFTLVEFEQAPAVAVAPAQDAPPMRYRPATAWGVDATGWSHWSPMEAWRATQDDADVQAFLDRHQDAVLMEVLWTLRNDDDAQQWTFRWQADEIGLQAAALRAEAPEAAGPLAPVFADTADRHRVVTEPLEFPDQTTPERLSVVPTPASLAARAEAFMGRSITELRVSLEDQASNGVQAGSTSLEKGPDPTTGSLDERWDLSTMSVGFDRNGTAWFMGGAEIHDDPGAPGLNGAPEPRSALAEAPAPPGITLPITVAASAGLLAAALALVYYFFPAFKSGAVGLFSRIQGDAVLEHPVRRTIHDYVAENPGSHAKEIHRVVGGGYGALDHHLQRLVSSGKLTSYNAAGYTCFFPKKTDRRLLPAAPALRHDTARTVLAALMQQPGATGSALAGQLSVGRATVLHHLKRLQEAGLVEAVRNGRRVEMFPTDVAHLAAQVGMAS